MAMPPPPPWRDPPATLPRLSDVDAICDREIEKGNGFIMQLACSIIGSGDGSDMR